MAPRPRIRRLLIGLVVILVLRQLWWTVFGKLNVDEFEEVQVLWLIDQGIWPWRDFLHTHLPFYNFLIYPVYAVGASVALPGLVRLALFPVVMLIVFEIGWLGRRATGSSTAGWLSVVLFLSSARIGRKLAEMRPDTIGLALLLLGLILFVSYLRQASPRTRSLYGCALVLGLSLLFTRKSVVLMPLMVIYLEMFQRSIPGLDAELRVRRTAAFGALLVTPMACVMLFFISLDSFPAMNLSLFLTSGITNALTQMHTTLKHQILIEFLPTNAFALVAGLMGTFEILRKERGRPSRSTPGLSLIGVYGALGLVQLILMPVILNHLLILPFLSLSILAAWKLDRVRSGTLIAFLVIALIVSNLFDIAHYEGRSAQLDKARFVQEHVEAGAPVLDSFSGYGTFRPIIGKLIYYRPAALEGEVQAAQDRVVQEALEKGEIGAVVDLLMLDFAPVEIRERVQAYYEPSSEYPEIWLPKEAGAED